jgi:hypothetical protein
MSALKTSKYLVAALLASVLSFSGLVGSVAANAAADVNVSVLDNATQNGIQAAFVSLIATAPADSDGDGLNDVDTGAVVVGGPTDANGDFAPTKTDQSALDDGTYGLVVSADGYQSNVGTLTVANSLGSVTVKLTSNATTNLKSLGAFGGTVSAVAADGRTGTFYAATNTVPGVYRSTDYAGSWSPVSLIRDEGVEGGVTDGLLGLNSSATVSNLITSGYSGEVAVTVGNTEWYSRDFGNNWHSFALPAGTWDTISWAHAHAADTTDHESVMLFTSSATSDMAYALMPTTIAGTGIGAAGKTEPTVTPVSLSGLASYKESSSDLVAVAAGASSVYIAVQLGASGTKIYEVAPGTASLGRGVAQPSSIPSLTRSTANAGDANPVRDLLLFGGQANIDGIPSSLVVYDRSLNAGKYTATAKAASLYPDANGNDVWTVASNIWTRIADGTFAPATGPIGDTSAGSNAPLCGEDSSTPVGFLAPMFASIGNIDQWSNAATTAMVRSCEVVAVADDSVINGTAIPAGAVIVDDAPGVSPKSSATFDSGFDFGGSNEVTITADFNYGVAKSATWLASDGSGSTQGVDANTYNFAPLLPQLGTNADSFIQNQAMAGKDITSGGYSVAGFDAPRVNDISSDPTFAGAQLVALDTAGGNRTLMTVDDGASYFTVGAGATAVTWWVDSNGQNWIASGSATNPSSILAVRQFSPSDLASTYDDVVTFGNFPDDPNYLGTRLNLSDSLAGFGASQFKLSGLSNPKVQAMQGIADTSNLLVAVSAGNSSSLALVSLAGDPGAETLGQVKYFNSANQVVGSMTAPSYNGLTVSSIKYCPVGSASAVADKAFVSLADTTGNGTGSLRVISGLASGTPTVLTPSATGLGLGSSDNIRDLAVDCDSGLLGLVSRNANGASAMANPFVAVSADAGASFTGLTKSASETLSASMGDGEAIALKSDSNAGTFDLVFASVSGDVLTAQLKLADVGKATIATIYKVVNDSSAQVATGLNGYPATALEFSPSDGFVQNYNAQTGNLASPTAHARTLTFGSATGVFHANLAGAKTPSQKLADAITASAQITGGAKATWSSAITLPQDKSVTITASSTSKLAVTISTVSPCSLTGAVLSSTASSGTCTVTFTTPGNGAYAAASETRTINLAAATPKQNDTITVTTKSGADAAIALGANGVILKNGDSLALAATASSGQAVAISLASGNCTYVAPTITANASSGSCQLTFTTPGNGTYNAANETRTVNLTNKPDSLTVAIAVGAPPQAAGVVATVIAQGQPTLVKYGQVAVVTATAASKAAVQVSSSAGCSITNGVVTPLTGTGSCTLSFSTNSAGGWDPINETRSINLSTATDALSVSATIAGSTQAWNSGNLSLIYGSTLSVAATAVSGSTVNISASGPCTLLNGVVRPNSGIGSCVVSFATQGSNKYAATNTTRTIDLSKAQDSITVNQTPENGIQSVWATNSVGSLVFGHNLNVSAVAASGNQVTLGISGGCSLSNGKIVATSGTGSCTLTASTPDGANYLGASAVRTINLSLASDSLTATVSVAGAAASDWATNQPTLRLDQTAAVVASSKSGKLVSLVASGPCTIANGKITPTSGSGLCTISGSTAADGNIAVATSSWSLVLAPKPNVQDSITLTIKTMGAFATSWSSPSAWTASSSTGTFGDQIQIDSATTSGTQTQISASGSCAISGKVLTITKGSGTCTITAIVPNSPGYNGLTIKRVINAGLLTLVAPSASAMKVGTKQALATRVTIAGKKIVYSYAVATGSSTLCTLSGSTLTAKKKGTCTVAVTVAALPGYYGALKANLAVKIS